MIGNALSPRPLGLLAIAALLVGGAVAAAHPGGSAAPAPAPSARAAVRPPVTVLAPGAPPALPAAAPCKGRRKSPRTPPSAALRAAFAILRRGRNADDALPARALRALKSRGLEPVDPHSARLLRADGAARAWVVPVPDVGLADPFDCRRGAAPREGLAVVAIGGAPVGGGGALRDLQRGIAPASVDPCAGAGRTMLSVSGIVPDGVEAVFVTAADGSATRADVRDNAYAFVLPRPRRPEPRYLVWTGKDGTPHVQPLGFVALGPRRACPPRRLPPLVTPNPWSGSCATALAPPAFVAPPRPPRVVRPPRVRRLPPAPRRAPRARRAIPAPLPLTPGCVLPPPPIPRSARMMPAPEPPPRPAPAPPPPHGP